MRPETAFRTRAVLPYLKTLNRCFWLPIQQVGICGDPDYIGFCPNQSGGLELKALGGKHEALQKWKGAQIVKTGNFYLKADPANWEWVKGLLLQLDRGERI